MLPSHRLVLSLGAALIAAAGPVPAAAQSAMQMIEQLRPGNGPPRGIQMPGAQPVAPAPQAPPSQAGAAPRPPAATVPRPSLRPAEAPAATTAPAGTPAVSITVQFPTNSATLTPAAERALAPLGQALSSPELAPYRFRIEGHTDTVGPDEANRALSQRRAEAVRDFLTQRYNVPAAKLEATGLGESQLLVRTGDNQAEQRNRRVQVLNIGS
ncbi:OmpA family protein [Pararoseomonas indoligenes]|uniref:OmpA family protein n=1 Tax=Roseomonas indoligenes TaxID=2820811 RepID=A0A940MVX4_9PROT|nr:OmpA family protein [Pararoseomonas indoligenes]MBP0491769.1 OmpA family protein [Pararoseomonas indoligenes]